MQNSMSKLFFFVRIHEFSDVCLLVHSGAKTEETHELRMVLSRYNMCELAVYSMQKCHISPLFTWLHMVNH